ncbi:MAG: membrane dipeptidase [Oscillospiraceae bacterium]|nr:membrane dipeptidase [Oscillospiraceae bacterium]
MTDVKELYLNSIVMDGSCPLAAVGEYVEEFYEGGFTTISAGIQPTEGILNDIAKNIIFWYDKFNRYPGKYILVKTVDDIYRAKKEGKLGIIFYHDNCQCLQGEIGMVEVYYNLGVRQQGLCYNYRNNVGDGCTEPANAGLSVFGERVVKEMNRLGMAIDLSHVGERTSLEAMEVSNKPVLFSHSNAKAIFDCKRNLTDEQAIRCAKMGGVIGLNGVGYFISNNKAPVLNDLIDHLDYYVKLVGIDHVSLGMDYYKGNEPYMSYEAQLALYEDRVNRNIWSTDTYPAPPWSMPKEVERPIDAWKWVPALRTRGYADSDICKVLGENMARYFSEVWK